MIPGAKRLIVFWIVAMTISVLALIKGLNAEAEPRVVYTSLGLLGIAAFLLFLIGRARQSRRR
jgi:hypothetical protein